MTKDGVSQNMRTIPLLITIFSLCTPAYAKYSGGTGEPNDPYQITTVEDLILLGDTLEDYYKHFILSADIDLDPNLPGHKVFDTAVIASNKYNVMGGQIIPFTGVFDGDGRTISNLMITGESFLGLFGYLGSEGVISNLCLENVNIHATGRNGAFSYIGGLVGENYGSIEMSYSTGTIIGFRYVGGLVGNNRSGKIKTSYSTGTITGTSYVGGLSGNNWYGNIIQCYSSANVNGTYDIGGLVGFNYNGIIATSYSTGSINGVGYVGGLVGDNFHGSIVFSHCTSLVNGMDDFIGGLAGRNGGSITTSYSTGTVTGSEYVGGLVGFNEYGGIATSRNIGTVSGIRIVGGLVGHNKGSVTTGYNTGAVAGNEDVGGLVGLNEYGSISTSYSTGIVNGIKIVGGLVGENSGSITMSYSTGTISGNESVGGLLGDNQFGSVIVSFWDMNTSDCVTSAGGIGLTTAEMQEINTFLNAGWDFVEEVINGTCDYWKSAPDDYPQLSYHSGDIPVMPKGLGTVEKPYLIQDARDLGTVWFEPLAHYCLETSLDLSDMTWSMAVVPWFGGTFDGNGYTISSLHIEGGGYLGLFGQSCSGSKISNLGLEIIDVNGMGGEVGGLVGYNYEGNITTSYSIGKINGGGTVGGLVGTNSKGSITTSYSIGIISGIGVVGGFVGTNNGSITASYSTGTVTGDQSVGGFVGLNFLNAYITKSYSTCTVNGGSRYFGGLIGQNWGSVENSYSTGEVNGHNFIGGLVGYGNPDFGIVNHCFWDVGTSGQSSSDGGTGKITADMLIADTFLKAGWDFVGETANGTDDIWWILEGQDYPRLWWEAE
jgi:hypothetical protein